MSGDITIGYLKRLTNYGNYLAGMLKSAVTITGGTISGVTISNVVNSGSVVSTAELDVVSTTTLSPITGLSVPVVAGGTYAVRAELPISTNGTGGARIGLIGTGGMVASSANISAKFFTANSVAVVNTLTLGVTGLASTSTVIMAELDGALVVGTAGNLTLQASQSVSTSGTMSVLTNGFMQVTRTS